jgi:hypothetical protein
MPLVEPTLALIPSPQAVKLTAATAPQATAPRIRQRQLRELPADPVGAATTDSPGA